MLVTDIDAGTATSTGRFWIHDCVRDEYSSVGVRRVPIVVMLGSSLTMRTSPHSYAMSGAIATVRQAERVASRSAPMPRTVSVTSLTGGAWMAAVGGGATPACRITTGAVDSSA